MNSENVIFKNSDLTEYKLENDKILNKVSNLRHKLNVFSVVSFIISLSMFIPFILYFVPLMPKAVPILPGSNSMVIKSVPLLPKSSILSSLSIALSFIGGMGFVVSGMTMISSIILSIEKFVLIKRGNSLNNKYCNISIKDFKKSRYKVKNNIKNGYKKDFFKTNFCSSKDKENNIFGIDLTSDEVNFNSNDRFKCSSSCDSKRSSKGKATYGYKGKEDNIFGIDLTIDEDYLDIDNKPNKRIRRR